MEHWILTADRAREITREHSRKFRYVMDTITAICEQGAETEVKFTKKELLDKDADFLRGLGYKVMYNEYTTTCWTVSWDGEE